MIILSALALLVDFMRDVAMSDLITNESGLFTESDDIHFSGIYDSIVNQTDLILELTDSMTR